jgi:hypothetical protein
MSSVGPYRIARGLFCRGQAGGKTVLVFVGFPLYKLGAILMSSLSVNDGSFLVILIEF